MGMQPPRVDTAMGERNLGLPLEASPEPELASYTYSKEDVLNQMGMLQEEARVRNMREVLWRTYSEQRDIAYDKYLRAYNKQKFLLIKYMRFVDKLVGGVGPYDKLDKNAENQKSLAG